MSQPSHTPLEFSYPEAAFAVANAGAARWSRAFTHLTEGFMTAAKAQAALASEIFNTEPNSWLKPVTPGNAAEITHEWLASSKAKREVLLHGVRQINADLATCFLTVAEDLTDGLNFKNGKTEAAPAPRAESAGPKVVAVANAAEMVEMLEENPEEQPDEE